MTNNCPECGERDTLYKNASGNDKCVLCGWEKEFKTGLIDEHPTREVNADCGDIITNIFDGVSRACVRKKVCTDGSNCELNPTGITEIKDGVWMVACYHHK